MELTYYSLISISNSRHTCPCVQQKDVAHTKFPNFYSSFQVDTPTLQEKLEAKKSLLYVRKPKIDFTPRYRMKGKSGSAQKFKRKQKVREDTQREYLKTAYTQREELKLDKKSKQNAKPQEILDRFKPKKVKK